MIIFKEIKITKEENFNISIEYFKSKSTFILSPEIYEKPEKYILLYLLEKYVYLPDNTWELLIKECGESAKNLYDCCKRLSNLFLNLEVSHYLHRLKEK